MYLHQDLDASTLAEEPLKICKITVAVVVYTTSASHVESLYLLLNVAMSATEEESDAQTTLVLRMTA